MKLRYKIEFKDGITISDDGILWNFCHAGIFKISYAYDYGTEHEEDMP